MDVLTGSGFPRPSSKASTKTFISLPDKGLLKRFTADPQHPQSVGPPTETSLRDAISRNERASSTNSFGLSESLVPHPSSSHSFACTGKDERRYG